MTVESGLLAHDPKPAEVVRRLAGAYRPERVYVSGSVAREDAGPVYEAIRSRFPAPLRP